MVASTTQPSAGSDSDLTELTSSENASTQPQPIVEKQLRTTPAHAATEKSSHPHSQSRFQFGSRPLPSP